MTESTITERKGTVETEEPKYPRRWFIWHEGKTKVHVGAPPEDYEIAILWYVTYRSPDAPNQWAIDVFSLEDHFETGQPAPWNFSFHISGALLVQEGRAAPRDDGNVDGPLVVAYAPGTWHTTRSSIAMRFPDAE
jgi:hypothetical protein